MRRDSARVRLFSQAILCLHCRPGDENELPRILRGSTKYLALDKMQSKQVALGTRFHKLRVSRETEVRERQCSHLTHSME